MTRITSSISINAPIETVFDYVTTPGHWPEWHPSSVSVTGATNHSLAVGEQVEEAFLVAGRRGRVIWTVTERNAPRRWVINGKILDSPGGGVITYALTPTADGVAFDREFVYPTPNLLYALIDFVYIRSRIRAESAQAVQQLKRILEKTSDN
ncbi:MAG TPA: SRPBCC family protein [Ktedonobacterales bacterium]|nr:SRPBCC family protein [Ktedonobacterales bacterium]